jgi:transposase
MVEGSKRADRTALERAIAGGLATRRCSHTVLVSKYCDHTPLYRSTGTSLPLARSQRRASNAP